MEIIPAWLIEELERLRKEQEQKRPELRIEIYTPLQRWAEPVPEEQEDSIVIPLRL